MIQPLSRSITLRELAGALDCELKGNAGKSVQYIGDINYLIRGFSRHSPDCLYYVENETTLDHLPADSIILLPESFAPNHEGSLILARGNPREKFIKLLAWIDNLNKINESEEDGQRTISQSARIAESARIYPGAYIGPYATIGENCVIRPMAVVEAGAEIGKGSIIHSGVVIGTKCIIGEYNIIYQNAVIGSDGFGYADINNERYKIPHIGNVITGNKVEIGACTTVDRSTIESTIIGDNTKIDNQVQIAHNCVIGKNVYMAGKAAMAGSVTIEDGAILAGGCSIKDHVKIARKSVILGMTGIESDTEPGQTYFGIPGRPAKEMHRIHSALKHLPELVKEFRKKNN